MAYAALAIHFVVTNTACVIKATIALVAMFCLVDLVFSGLMKVINNNERRIGK